MQFLNTIPRGFRIILVLYVISIISGLSSLLNPKGSIFWFSFLLNEEFILIFNVASLFLTILVAVGIIKKYTWGWKLLLVMTLLSLMNNIIYFGTGAAMVSATTELGRNFIMIEGLLIILLDLLVIYYTYKNRNYFNK